MRGIIGIVVAVVVALVAIWAVAEVADFVVSGVVWGVALLIGAVVIVSALLTGNRTAV